MLRNRFGSITMICRINAGLLINNRLFGQCLRQLFNLRMITTHEMKKRLSAAADGGNTKRASHPWHIAGQIQALFHDSYL